LAQDNEFLERENDRLRALIDSMTEPMKEMLPGRTHLFPNETSAPASGVHSRDIPLRQSMAGEDMATSTKHFTTLMLRNLPNKYTREMLVALLDSQGFVGKYTFVYLPVDFKTHAGLGYAVVDMLSPSEAQEMWLHFEGFSRWGLPTDKVCNVRWSVPHQQGLEAQIARYRNSPVMHEAVPESWKPLLFQDGVSMPFPLPTRKIRVPRIRDYVC
jgi:hypothetical protein